VLVLHGGGGNGRQIEGHTKFSTLADREGFIAVYPDAVDRNWNDGRGAAGISAQQRNIDDVAFLSGLLAGLTREFAVDARRVYVTGVSNGAFMSQRLAAEKSERIAAIAPVIGGMGPLIRDRFAPKAPVSVLLMNGTDDPLVPYQGGPVARSANRGETIGIDEIVKLWSTRDRCSGQPETVLLPDVDPADGTRVRRTTYARCADHTAVILYTIEGGGHNWPGGAQYLPRAIIGRTSRDLDATAVVWQFFADHPRR
jgi:polyhydroxybutyrate depolymerase